MPDSFLQGKNNRSANIWSKWKVKFENSGIWTFNPSISSAFNHDQLSKRLINVFSSIKHPPYDRPYSWLLISLWKLYAHFTPILSHHFALVITNSRINPILQKATKNNAPNLQKNPLYHLPFARIIFLISHAPLFCLTFSPNCIQFYIINKVCVYLTRSTYRDWLRFGV